jgi:hypothetical protein
MSLDGLVSAGFEQLEIGGLIRAWMHLSKRYTPAPANRTTSIPRFLTLVLDLKGDL